jgi:hypothetical protein
VRKYAAPVPRNGDTPALVGELFVSTREAVEGDLEGEAVAERRPRSQDGAGAPSAAHAALALGIGA